MSAAKVSCETREDRALSRTKMSPALRFKGFEGEWRRQPLDFVAEINPRTEIPSEFEYVDLESVVGTNLISSRKVTRDVAPSRAQRLASPGDVFFQTVRPYQKNNYFFPGSDKPFVFSSGYAQLKPIIAGRYLFCAIQAPRFVNDVLVNCTGSSYPAIAPSALREIDMAYPSDENEACEIGSCLTNFDFFLKERQSALEKLEALKKSMLVNMFPQGDAKVPKIRFKGFEGEWKESKIGDLFDERDERNQEGELLSVTMREGIIRACENGRYDNSNSDKSLYKAVRAGDIAYNSMRMWQGACGMSEYSGIVSPAYTVLVPHDETCSKFFEYVFKRTESLSAFKHHSQGMTSDTWNLKFPLIKTISLKFPSLTEQRKIAAYIKSLDRLIAARRDELEQLKHMKAALLDRMFV